MEQFGAELSLKIWIFQNLEIFPPFPFSNRKFQNFWKQFFRIEVVSIHVKYYYFGPFYIRITFENPDFPKFSNFPKFKNFKIAKCGFFSNLKFMFKKKRFFQNSPLKLKKLKNRQKNFLVFKSSLLTWNFFTMDF